MAHDRICRIERLLNEADWTACAMEHERVLLDSITKEPIESELSESGFERHCLCAPELRRRRPGCGHTNIRNLLIRELTTISGVLSARERRTLEILIQGLGRLDLEISLLDHQKGDAELRLAQAIQAKAPTLEPRKEINKIESEHVELLAQLRRMRDSILELCADLRLNHAKQ